ncbi:hypothetical protein [Rhizobium tibeticum]|uniref:hypothetical protein n=1 Tax=Rhizobium tibeticum TaxID=501024 RepID=UPI0027D79FDC|nr:hypothetical protein [Rhizobium tibeticum]
MPILCVNRAADAAKDRLSSVKVTPMEVLGGFLVEEMQSDDLQLLEKLHDTENRLLQIHELSGRDNG